MSCDRHFCLPETHTHTHTQNQSQNFNKNKAIMFALTSSSSAVLGSRSRVENFNARKVSRRGAIKIASSANSHFSPMEKEVALKATLFVNNNKTKATRSVIMSSTAGNPVPTVKAGGNADLEKKFCTFIFAMFGFFSIGMLLPGSAQLWFGPDPPFPKFMHIAMSYWNVDGGSVIANWWSRMTAVLFLSFLGGPFLFGAEITKSYLKQVTAMLTGHLCMFINVTFFSPVAKVAWYPQIVLQIALVALGLKLINEK